MASRRRRIPPRQTGQDRRTQATALQQPSGPEYADNDTSKPLVVDDDLHFKTGGRGRLARFFVRLRAAGDPYDETVVLPALIVIIMMRLNTLNRIGDWAVLAAVVGTGVMAGAWVGASLGIRATYRVALRGISVGAIEAAAYPLIHGRTEFAWSFLVANLLFFSYAYLVVAPIQDLLVCTEKEWQAGLARVALLRKFLRITLGAEELKGQSTPVALMVWITRILLPSLLAWLVSKILEIDLGAFLHSA